MTSIVPRPLVRRLASVMRNLGCDVVCRWLFPGIQPYADEYGCTCRYSAQLGVHRRWPYGFASFSLESHRYHWDVCCQGVVFCRTHDICPGGAQQLFQALSATSIKACEGHGVKLAVACTAQSLAQQFAVAFFQFFTCCQLVADCCCLCLVQLHRG